MINIFTVWPTYIEQNTEKSNIHSFNHDDGLANSISSHQTIGVDESMSHLLEWVHSSDVVLLPDESFYISVGKRIFDITTALLVSILVLWWLIPIIGVFILLESSGPFLYIQYRSGRRGRQFPCIKFRTMIYQKYPAEFRQTRQNDDRITRLGSLLRRTNLDEVPQFLNVLVGHMSLVGPRPHAVSHDAEYWSSTAYRERYHIRPGITGLAQIRGARGGVIHPFQMPHRVKYDHFYISRQAFLLDLKICVKTIKLTLKGDPHAW